MAQIRPFRALRYSPAAGPLERLVAPPYDVVSAQEREHYLALDPHNVVHLTLPESDEQAARELSDWQADGVLERETEPAVWALSQSYTGPDGVARIRNGLMVTLRLEPYERRVVLPHERTHAGPKEGRLDSCGRHGPSSSRSSCCTTATRSRFPGASRTSQRAVTGSGASRTIPAGASPTRSS
jgi:uncharacterized protein (DUF1015 family)